MFLSSMAARTIIIACLCWISLTYSQRKESTAADADRSVPEIQERTVGMADSQMLGTFALLMLAQPSPGFSFWQAGLTRSLRPGPTSVVAASQGDRLTEWASQFGRDVMACSFAALLLLGQADAAKSAVPALPETPYMLQRSISHYNTGLHNVFRDMLFVPPALADEPPIEKPGEALFNMKCVGCHVDGGNVLAYKRTLFTAALEKNGYATEESFANLMRQGKGRMPAYGEKGGPLDKLTEEQIVEITKYALSRAAEDWK